jgi:hypothetical protein
MNKGRTVMGRGLAELRYRDTRGRPRRLLAGALACRARRRGARDPRLETLTALVYLPSGQGLDRRGSGPPPSDDPKRRIEKVDRNRAGSRFDADSQPTATRFVAGANHAAHPVRSATASRAVARPVPAWVALRTCVPVTLNGSVRQRHGDDLMSSTTTERELDQFTGAIPRTDTTIATTAGHGTGHKTSASPGVGVPAGDGISCSHRWKANQSLKCHWARPVCSATYRNLRLWHRNSALRILARDPNRRPDDLKSVGCQI